MNVEGCFFPAAVNTAAANVLASEANELAARQPASFQRSAVIQEVGSAAAASAWPVLRVTHGKQQHSPARLINDAVRVLDVFIQEARLDIWWEEPRRLGRRVSGGSKWINKLFWFVSPQGGVDEQRCPASL